MREGTRERRCEGRGSVRVSAAVDDPVTTGLIGLIEELGYDALGEETLSLALKAGYADVACVCIDRESERLDALDGELDRERERHVRVRAALDRLKDAMEADRGD